MTTSTRMFMAGFVAGLAKMGAVIVVGWRGISAIRAEWKRIDASVHAYAEEQSNCIQVEESQWSREQVKALADAIEKYNSEPRRAGRCIIP